MDESTKRFVVTLGAFAAGIGPVVYGVGLLTSGIRALTIAMANNPYTAIAIGILAIATAAYMAIKGVNDLEKALLKQAGIESLTGSEEERNKLLAEQKLILSDLASARVRLKNAEGDNTAIASEKGKIARYEQQLGTIDQAIAKSNALSWQNYELAKSAKEASDKAKSLEKSLGGTTTELVAQAGSIGALEAELEGLQAQLKITGDTLNRSQLGAQINQLTAEIKAMKDVAMANILPITNPLERATIATQNLTSSIAGLNRGFIPLAKAPVTITEMTSSMVIAQEVANQFTNSFGAGMANLIVQGGKLSEVLSNIGKLLLSSAIQTGIKLLLMGTSGFGVVGGSKGLLGGLFSTSVSTVPTAVMGAGTTSVTGTFKVQGTDLIAVINRSERQLR
jgi:hypothetical protein